MKRHYWHSLVLLETMMQISTSHYMYSVAWDSLDKVMIWIWDLQEQKVVELQRTHHYINNGNNGKWTKRFTYTCTRNGTGGDKPYNKLHPEWGRKVPSKWTGCGCHIIVKGLSKCLGSMHQNTVTQLVVLMWGLYIFERQQKIRFWKSCTWELVMIRLWIMSSYLASIQFMDYISFLKYKETAMGALWCCR